jgi:3-oxoacyl-[acyl-carrier-protein] synthase II
VGGTGTRLNVTDFLWRGAERVARNGAGPPAAVCRPFDARRTGMVYGEGAAQVVLESRQHAARRGASQLARILATATRCEAAADNLRPTGDAIRRTIRAALEAAHIEPRQIGHVNAHGNSTREDDPIEAQAIRTVLGDVPVTAPKSYFGNLGPGSGMVELVISLLALEHGAMPPTLNYQTPDPECPVNVVTQLRPADRGTFVKLNHNTTGQAAAVIIEGESGR